MFSQAGEYGIGANGFTDTQIFPIKVAYLRDRSDEQCHNNDVPSTNIDTFGDYYSYT